MKINYVKIDKNMPDFIRGSEYSAGTDLYSTEEDFVLYPGCETIVSTGCHIEIPEGYWGHISVRSGLGFKQNISSHIGVVDADFRGELKVKLFHFMDMYKVSEIDDETGLIKMYNEVWLNHGLEIKKYDRIANLVIVPYLKCDFVEVDSLSETVRGEGGYGSTGR